MNFQIIEQTGLSMERMFQNSNPFQHLPKVSFYLVVMLTTPKDHQKYNGISRKYKGSREIFKFLDLRYKNDIFGTGGCITEVLTELLTLILAQSYMTYLSYVTVII